MKNTLSLIFILCCFYSYSQTWDELIYQGKKERANGNFAKAGELIAKGAKLKEKDNFEHYYYAAIMFANANNFNSSFTMLDKAIEAGMFDLARWERNNRLKVLHTDERWHRLVKKMKNSERKYAATLTHPALRDELKQMWQNDQDLVGKWKEQRKVVDRNTVRLNEIIDQYGWPNRTMVGKDGVWMAWAIAQHAHDLDFQKKCLKLLERNLHTKDAEPVLYAELFDRICRNSNQKQMFGMAIVDENGTKKFHPIEKEWEVDQRRKSIGLGPIEEYANENYVKYEQ